MNTVNNFFVLPDTEKRRPDLESECQNLLETPIRNEEPKIVLTSVICDYRGQISTKFYAEVLTV